MRQTIVLTQQTTSEYCQAENKQPITILSLSSQLVFFKHFENTKNPLSIVYGENRVCNFQNLSFALSESTFFFRATNNKITPMTKDIATQVGNSGIEGEGAKLGEGRVELDEGLGEALGVSKGSSMNASEILTGVRSGYLSIASTM
jgi:hypothetical protein